uniref:Uncharacterized protein n=1 Tax=Burkholderia cenocepacia TaxID=95486 RepID=A0A071M8Z8_9BURK
MPLPGPMIRQTIGLSFLHRHERDPNLLALATVCRRPAAGGQGADRTVARRSARSPCRAHR